MRRQVLMSTPAAFANSASVATSAAPWLRSTRRYFQLEIPCYLRRAFTAVCMLWLVINSGVRGGEAQELS